MRCHKASVASKHELHTITFAQSPHPDALVAFSRLILCLAPLNSACCCCPRRRHLHFSVPDRCIFSFAAQYITSSRKNSWRCFAFRHRPAFPGYFSLRMFYFKFQKSEQLSQCSDQATGQPIRGFFTERRSSPQLPERLRAHPASCSMVPGSFHGSKADRSVADRSSTN